MAKKIVEVFQSMEGEEYRLMWHISALAERRYRIAILSNQRGVIDEVTYRGGFYEQCLTMNQELSLAGEKIYVEVENDADRLDLFKDDRIDSGGLGESFCLFCRGGSTQNYHEANILLWAVKEAPDELACTKPAAINSTDFCFHLRNLTGLSCLSYFMCGHTTDKVSVKIVNEQKDKTYVEIDSKCKDKIAHLTMGSALTMKEALQLEIVVEGNNNISAICDCSTAQGKSLNLVHYHVKSYDKAANRLPFSLDILGWTAI